MKWDVFSDHLDAHFTRSLIQTPAGSVLLPTPRRPLLLTRVLLELAPAMAESPAEQEEIEADAEYDWGRTLLSSNFEFSNIIQFLYDSMPAGADSLKLLELNDETGYIYWNGDMFELLTDTYSGGGLVAAVRPTDDGELIQHALHVLMLGAGSPLGLECGVLGNGNYGLGRIINDRPDLISREMVYRTCCEWRDMILKEQASLDVCAEVERLGVPRSVDDKELFHRDFKMNYQEGEWYRHEAEDQLNLFESYHREGE